MQVGSAFPCFSILGVIVFAVIYLGAILFAGPLWFSLIIVFFAFTACHGWPEPY